MDIRGRKMKKPPACVQCRKRKIGCDRVKPICGNCMKHNKMDCFYPDVPGQYVPSSSSSSNTRQVANGPYLNSYYASRRVSKETAALLQKNPELASLEQIREYNTRLQLLNAQNQLNNRSSAANATLNQQHTQYIPKSVPSLESKPVTSANESSTPLNWVQGPAIFHMLTSPYTQDEIINHEMNFLKGRLLELQEITGKKITGVNLDLKQDSSAQMQSSHSNRNQEEFLTIKKRKLSEDGVTDGDGKPIPESERRPHLNEFKDLDPQFLDTNKVFNVFNSAISEEGRNRLWLLPKNINKSSIFQIQYLIERDPFLFKFFNDLNILIETQFNGPLHDLVASRNSIERNSGISQILKFPSQSITQTLINKYLSTITETNSILPILKPKRLLPIVEQLFPSNTIIKSNSKDFETIFQVFSVTNDQLLNLGFITLCLLILFESLNSTVLIPLRDDEHLQLFNVLFNYLPLLKSNLTTLRFEIEKRSMCNIETLRFISLWKYYQFVMDTSSSSSFVIDYDEDMHMACLLSLNHETQNQSHILTWNFIFKNYCWRHLFLGQLPLLMSEPFTNSTPIIDPLLNNDFELIDFEVNLMKYLQSKDQQLSIDKIIQLIKLLKNKNIEVSQGCLTTPSIINNIMDSLIYRNSMLYLNFYLLLQFETLKNYAKFNEILEDFLELSRETLFFVFSNLANIKFAGHEFTFINKSIVVLQTLVLMLLALYQRSFDSSKRTNDANEISEQTDIHSNNDNSKRIKNKNVIHLIINKIAMLLSDYTKNCKKQNKLIENLIIKIKTISKYIKNLEENKVTTSADSNYSINNGFSGISAEQLIKLNHELSKISESLIKTDFYEQRKNSTVSNGVLGAAAPVDSDANSDTFGLTKENFNEVFEAIRS
ncbi:ANL_HP_G0186260.mRNA.1.CDS.1 [Saccharomyces cerevisiae]|nr:ANL_HP_G0186260.mRNA.1.CDS.1 [Saccharomyces cerevisiae]CAI6387604.1 ANL_HP_G0186260.mRNA.1.CDS.1 [Saccharomyces cerevisiae]